MRKRTIMAKSEDKEKLVWGTWEELLLACAVKRYGTKNWDSVAMEIQKRSSSPHFLLTSHNCKEKYLDLSRRFTNDDTDKTESHHRLHNNNNNIDDSIPWLEELRKLRVKELRREVKRYDTSIVSLQLKVKRLKEEREQSFKDKIENEEEKSDPSPDRVEEEEANRAQTRDDNDDNCKSTPPEVTGNPISGEESGRDNHRFPDESKQGESLKTGPVESEEKKESVKITAADKSDPVTTDSPGDKPAGESSCNGSSETIAKDSVVVAPVEKSAEAVPTRDESPELWESMAESKGGGGGEGNKESSDVQSSTSLSRKNHRQKVISGSSSGDEPETDEVSPNVKRKSDKSQPLLKFLEIIKSHKYSSVFERRLDTQETFKYKSLIRQHMDLEVLQSRLKKGHYSSCTRKFFRDLLLLFNNALIFFPKNSLEFVAAHELRQLVSKEIAVRFPKVSVPASSSIPKSDPEPCDTLLLKPKSSGPIITCKKRSSITAKASNSIGGEKKGEQKATLVEDKKPTILDRKQLDSGAGNVIEEASIIKKRKRDKSRSSRTMSKSQNNSNNSRSLNITCNQNPSPGSNSNVTTKGKPVAGGVDDHNEEKEKDKKEAKDPEKHKEKKKDPKEMEKEEEKEKEREKKSSTSVGKKQSVANFLNRMKRNSSSCNGSLLESLKKPAESTSSGKEGKMMDHKKSGGGGGKKEQSSRHNSSSSGKQAQDSSPSKRSVGRPSKRTNTSSPPLPPPKSGKRTREKVEAEVVAASRQPAPRKRSRR